MGFALEKFSRAVAGQRKAPEVEVLVIDEGCEDADRQGLPARTGLTFLRVIRQSALWDCDARQTERARRPRIPCCYLRIATACLIRIAYAKLVSQRTNSREGQFSGTATADTRSTGGRAEALPQYAVQQGRLADAGRLMYLITLDLRFARFGTGGSGSCSMPLRGAVEDHGCGAKLMKRGRCRTTFPAAISARGSVSARTDLHVGWP